MGWYYVILMFHSQGSQNCVWSPVGTVILTVIKRAPFWLPLVELGHGCGFTSRESRNSLWIHVPFSFRLSVFWSTGLNIGLAFIKYKRPAVVACWSPAYYWSSLLESFWDKAKEAQGSGVSLTCHDFYWRIWQIGLLSLWRVVLFFFCEMQVRGSTANVLKSVVFDVSFTLWPWATYLTPSCLDFLFCRVWIVLSP